MPETKTLLGVEVKSADEGKALVKFAAYDEIDHHGDVTLKGAFRDGKSVLVSSYNHASWGGALPVGKGVIRDSADGKSAVAELQFFMNTQAGRETFETVKATGELQQWSYGFNVEDQEQGEFEGKSVRFLKSLDVYEISPVLVGAGKSTETLAIKGLTPEQIEQMAEWLEEQKANSKPKPKPKPKRDDEDEDEDNPKNSKKPQNNNDEDEEEEDDEKNPRRRKKPGNSGKMRMSDQCLETVMTVKDLADRAEEIVALRKAEGKKGLSTETQMLLGLVGDQLERIKALASGSDASSDEDPNTVSVGDALVMRTLKNLSEE